jgi:hypothetical protein
MNTPERVETMTNNDAEYDDMPGLGMESDTDDDADNAENNANSSHRPANTTVIFVPGIYSTAGAYIVIQAATSICFFVFLSICMFRLVLNHNDLHITNGCTYIICG